MRIKTKYIYIIIFLVVVLLFNMPRILWEVSKSKDLNVFIVDKTIPDETYREHKSLVWMLNNEKYVKSEDKSSYEYKNDYYGFFPKENKEYEISDKLDIPTNTNLIYIADTYGVYTEEYYGDSKQGNKSERIYGGITLDEVNIIKKAVYNGSDLVAEFNTFGSPTDNDTKETLYDLLGLNWTGWKGRYFEKLDKGIEVPNWAVSSYESKEGEKWNFTGYGFVFVDENEEVVVLTKEDIGETGIEFSFTEEGTKEFGENKAYKYMYWFDIIEPINNSQVLAKYDLKLSKSGQSKLIEANIPLSFPAVIKNRVSSSNTYYFAGDYVDYSQIPKSYKKMYYMNFIKLFANDDKDNFFWKAYVPMLGIILENCDRYKNQGENDIYEEDIKMGSNTNDIYKEDIKMGSNTNDIYQEDIKMVSRINNKFLQIYKDGNWEDVFLKGVNIGASKPGHFPGELAITKEEYLRWFKYISDMNSNVIRVYTTLKPDFYDALYEYNSNAIKKLYLMQGVWINEEDITELKDAYANNDQIKNSFIKDSVDLVDIIHGNATLPLRPGFASGEYKSDVSKYVIGWILGIEWEADFVDGTNQNNPNRDTYSGVFLNTEGASPFEAFLCEVGDKVLDYEAEKYNMTRALSFTNWLTTDMLKHPNEPYEKEDKAIVNTEHIKSKESFKSGLFASYHIYPYYPEFINYQKEYISFKDKTGNINTYKAYLRDLIKEHTVPVLVSEFGVPASRGKAHDSKYSGYNQGNHDETEQGNIIASLLKDIYDEGYCGALVFTWQDEWFKRTWNTMDFDLPDRRPFWSNPQTNEQEFGLLAFDPGIEKSICYVDGEILDWSKDTPIIASYSTELYVKSDEKYVYIMAKTKDYDFNNDTFYISLDTIFKQGNLAYKNNNISFERPADFLIQIDGDKNSRIFVDSYYDSFYYIYAEQLHMIEKNAEYLIKGNGIFNPMYHCLSREFFLPEDKNTVPFSQYETGVLTIGDANPENEGYNSLTDFSFKNGYLEIRIPWQLLNVIDPSTNSIMGDLYKNQSIKSEQSEGIYIGAGIVKPGLESSEVIKMGYYNWSGWDMPNYHERIKPSYYIIKDAFRSLN